jgi:hypothetical protein
MKKARLILTASMLSIAAFSAVTLSSCSKDETCLPGYEGKDCKTEMRTKFMKTWNANETSGTEQLVYTCNVAAGTNVNQVVISKTFSDNFFQNNVNATVDGNIITIPSQKPDGSGSEYSVEGSGTYTGGEISWSYFLIKDATGNKITTTGIWK